MRGMTASTKLHRKQSLTHQITRKGSVPVGGREAGWQTGAPGDALSMFRMAENSFSDSTNRGSVLVTRVDADGNT